MEVKGMDCKLIQTSAYTAKAIQKQSYMHENNEAETNVAQSETNIAVSNMCMDTKHILSTQHRSQWSSGERILYK